jgi:hypothetical protein
MAPPWSVLVLLATGMLPPGPHSDLPDVFALNNTADVSLAHLKCTGRPLEAEPAAAWLASYNKDPTDVCSTTQDCALLLGSVDLESRTKILCASVDEPLCAALHARYKKMCLQPADDQQTQRNLMFSPAFYETRCKKTPVDWVCITPQPCTEALALSVVIGCTHRSVWRGYACQPVFPVYQHASYPAAAHSVQAI